MKFGLIPEFIGRVPLNVSLHALDEAALLRILTEPKNSLVRQYKKLFEMDGVTLEFAEGALEAVAKKAIQRKTGARGLRSIMEKSMLDMMYKIPSDPSVKRCEITADMIVDDVKFAIEDNVEPIAIEDKQSA